MQTLLDLQRQLDFGHVLRVELELKTESVDIFCLYLAMKEGAYTVFVEINRGEGAWEAKFNGDITTDKWNWIFTNKIDLTDFVGSFTPSMPLPAQWRQCGDWQCPSCDGIRQAEERSEYTEGKCVLCDEEYDKRWDFNKLLGDVKIDL